MHVHRHTRERLCLRIRQLPRQPRAQIHEVMSKRRAGLGGGGGCGCLILGPDTEPQGSVSVSVSSSSQFLPGNPTTSGFFPKVSPNVYGLSMYTQNKGVSE